MIAIQPINPNAFHTKKTISKSLVEIIEDCENSGKSFSLKRILLEDLLMVDEEKKKEYIEKMKRESENLMRKNLRNNLKIHDFFHDMKRKEFNIIMDDCTFNLKYFIFNQKRRNFRILYHILLGILNGIQINIYIYLVELIKLKYLLNYKCQNIF